MHDEERRRHPRARLDGRAVGRATIFTGFRVLALSETGATVEMEMPLALGSPCEIALHLMDGQVDIRARVEAVQPGGAGYRVELAFLSVDEPDQPLLRAFLEREPGGGR